MNSRIKNILIAIAFFFCIPAIAQQDSVVIRVGKESKVIFFIKDKKDLETLKHYNFQALMDDMVQKLENRDSSAIEKPSTAYLKDSSATVSHYEEWRNERRNHRSEDSDYYNSDGKNVTISIGKNRNRRTRSSFNVDVGMNNYLENGKFPASNSLYNVKPWGSWYVSLNETWRTRVSKKFFLEWGGGVSWYNFKFENVKTSIGKDDNGVIFGEDQRDVDFRKSKLTVVYVNLSAIPMIDFGDNSRRAGVFGKAGSKSFRIGAGPYVGYRIDSYTKKMYFDNGERYRNHYHDSFYLNNIRYGLRLQMGFKDTDIFFNYDMNELFAENKGPKVQAFSFGITL